MTLEEAGSINRKTPLTRLEVAMWYCDRFFKRKLACRIDCWPVGLRVWWYNWTARRAWYFHRRWCPSCRGR